MGVTRENRACTALCKAVDTFQERARDAEAFRVFTKADIADLAPDGFVGDVPRSWWEIFDIEPSHDEDVEAAADAKGVDYTVTEPERCDDEAEAWFTDGHAAVLALLSGYSLVKMPDTIDSPYFRLLVSAEPDDAKSPEGESDDTDDPFVAFLFAADKVAMALTEGESVTPEDERGRALVEAYAASGLDTKPMDPKWFQQERKV